LYDQGFGPDLAFPRRGEVTLRADSAGKRRTIMASTLVVLKFDTPEGADKALEIAVNLQKQQLLQMQDAAIVTWPQGKRKPKTRHLGDQACAGAWYGAFWGMLFGMLFFMPFLGAALGGAVGALSGHFAEYGINKEFMEQVRGKVKEGTSALFLLITDVTTDRVIDAFRAAPNFEIIASNLSHEQEEKLKAAFAS
jgi:uncharacterized membrane protein